jgi:hypothetical protein
MGLAEIRKFRYAPCASQSYANLIADPSSNLVYPQPFNIEDKWGVAQVARAFQVSDLAHWQSANGPKHAQISFETEARSYGGASPGAASGVATGDGETGPLFKSVFGTQTADSGATFGTGSSSTVAGVTAGTVGFLTIGGFILAQASDSNYYIRQIRSKGATTVTLDRTLPNSANWPASGNCYAANWFSKADTGHQHMWFDMETADYRRYFRGCLGNVAFSFPLHGRPAFKWTFQALDWNNPSVSQPSPTYPTNLPTTVYPIRNARVWVGTQLLVASEFTLELGNEIVPMPSTQAVNGIQKWVIKDAKRELSFKVEYNDTSNYGATLVTDHINKTIVDILVEAPNGGPGNSFAFAAPFCELTSVDRVTVNGIDYLECKARILRNDGSISASVPDLAFGLL